MLALTAITPDMERTLAVVASRLLSKTFSFCRIESTRITYRHATLREPLQASVFLSACVPSGDRRWHLCRLPAGFSFTHPMVRITSGYGRIGGARPRDQGRQGTSAGARNSHSSASRSDGWWALTHRVCPRRRRLAGAESAEDARQAAADSAPFPQPQPAPLNWLGPSQ